MFKLLANPWAILGLVGVLALSNAYTGYKVWTLRGAVERAANLEAENKRLAAKFKASEEILADMEKEAVFQNAAEGLIERQLDETRKKLAAALAAGTLASCPWTDDDDRGLRKRN